MKKLFKDRIFYETYPSSFCDSNGDGRGDIQGIISKLDYISNLGFDGLWVNPFYKSPMLDGGYDISNFFEIDERFGTMDDLKELIEECHKRDILLFLDLVPGHASIYNPDFLKSAEATKNDKSDLFIWTDNVWHTYDNYRQISGFYDRFGCYIVNFFAHQPAINYGFAKKEYDWQMKWDDPKCPGKDYLVKIMNFYLDMGVDGFRVDMADSLVKGEDDKECTIKLWNKMFDEVKKSHKEFYTTSEWSNPDRALRAGFSSDFILDHQDNCSHMLFRQKEDGYEPLLHQYNAKLYRNFTKNLLWHIESMQKYDGELSFISGNHDSFRIADFLNDEELRLAYLFIYTMPGVPYLFAGDELGQKTNRNLTSKEGGYQRTGTRIPMVFDNTENRGFSKCKDVSKLYLPIDNETFSVMEQLEDKNSLLNFIKELIKIRKSEDDLRSKDFKLLDKPLAYSRGKIKVFINLKDEDQKFEVESGEILLSVGKVEFSAGKLVLKKHQAVIFKEA